MLGAFQDQENLYLIMDYLSGGDLREFFRQHKVFDEKKVSNTFIYCRIYCQMFIDGFIISKKCKYFAS